MTTRKEELLQRLAPIGRAEAAIKANLQPLQEGLTALEEIRSKIIDDFDDIVIDRCVGCRVPILIGEKGFSYADGPYNCPACAPTYGDLKRDIETHEANPAEALFDTRDPEALQRYRARLNAHLVAGGSLEDPYVTEL